MSSQNNYLNEHISTLTTDAALEEASRCLLCHDAPCSANCPAETDPASFIRSIRFENFYGAAETIRKANILGGICARVCPYNKLCEKECSRGEIDTPIKIGELQRFATEYEKANNLKILETLPRKSQKIAIIGSGPAGLAAAGQLAVKGYPVTLFEKERVLGGILSYGIVPSRLPQNVINEEIQYIKDLGVSFKLNIEFGKDITIPSLKNDGFSAIVLAVGNIVSKRLDISGSGSKGIYRAIDFLAMAKQSAEKIKIGESVIVIGGGDVAIDSALTANLLGAKRVTILYRRRLEDMPASKEELDYAKSLNINFYTTFTPQNYVVKKGKVVGIAAKGTYDTSTITLDADMVIEAIGQKAEDLGKAIDDLKIEDNKIKVNDAYKTSVDGIFAVGDIVNGGATVVDAVKEGKAAANEIDKLFSSKEKSKQTNKIPSKSKKSLEIEFCGVKCENPFFLSSSPVGSNYEMCSKALETGWGGIVYKTIVKFYCNECSPRFDSLRKESTPFIGFKNMEQLSERHYEENFEDIAKLKKDFPDKVLVASIMGQNEEEWTELAMLATQAGADMVECNFSCPQVTKHGLGSDIGQDPALVKVYSAAVRKGTHLPILAKMTPNIGNMEIPAIASIEGGADAIAAINTVKAITAVDLDKLVCLPIVNGKSSISGYSGKAVKPIALRFIAQMKQHAKLSTIPISGMGGIENWRDAVEFFLVGASNLQVTTSIMQYGYRIVEDLISGTSHYLDIKGFNSLSEIVGKSLNNIIPAENLDRSFIVKAKVNDDKCIGCGRCYLSCSDGGHQAIEWDEKERKTKNR